MKALKVITLILSIILFVGFSYFYLAGRGVDTTLLEEDFYQGMFDQTELSEIISDGIAGFIGNSIADNAEVEADDPVIEPFRQTFDSRWVEDNFTEVAGNFTAWMKGDRESEVLLDISEDRVELQNSLNQHLEDLSDEELSRLGMSAAQIDQVRSGQFEIGGNIPDEITLSDLSEDESGQAIEEARDNFQGKYNLYSTWTPIILIVVAVLILLTAGIFAGLKWIGGLMAFTGLSMLLAMYISQGLISVGISNSLEGSAGEESAKSVVSYFISQFNEPSLLYAAAGLILLIIGIIGGKISKPKTEAKAAAPADEAR